jgi:hypothetical protein
VLSGRGPKAFPSEPASLVINENHVGDNFRDCSFIAWMNPKTIKAGPRPANCSFVWGKNDPIANFERISAVAHGPTWFIVSKDFVQP